MVHVNGDDVDVMNLEKRLISEGPTVIVTHTLKRLQIHFLSFYVTLLVCEETETGRRTEKSPRGFNLELCHR